MSEVSSTQPAAFVRPVGWSSGRARRARLFALAAIAAVGLAMFSLTLPWYAFSVSGTARCTLGPHPQAVTVVTAANVHVPGVVGAACITGYQTVHQDQLMTASGVSTRSSVFGPSAEVPAPSSQFGLPSTAVFLAVGGLLVAAAMLLRNGFPGVLGLLSLAVAWNAFGGLQQTMTWGVGGQLNAAQSGLGVYQFAMTFLVACSVLGCGWVAWINHTQRAAVRRQARAEGREHELPPSFVDSLAASALRFAQQRAEHASGEQTPAAAR